MAVPFFIGVCRLLRAHCPDGSARASNRLRVHDTQEARAGEISSSNQ
jgi:hypothetical protein